MKITTAIRQPKPVLFLKEVKTELAKVAWPKKEQTVRLTLIVVGVSVVMALFLGGLDFLFTKLVSLTVK
jgi:preprotein translocase subunit SecE